MSVFRTYGMFLLVAALLLSTATSHAQFPSVRGFVDEGQRKLPVDHAAFASDSSGLVRLELYYQVHNFVLKFEEVNGLFEAVYNVTIVIRDDDGKAVVRDESSGQITAATRDRALSEWDFRTRQAAFDLPPDKYRIELTLKDDNASTTISRDVDIKLRSPVGKYPTLSEIELVHLAERGQPISGTFGKGDMNLVPSVTGAMGGTEDNPRLMYYVEIYRGQQEPEEIRTETLLRRQRGGKMVYRDSLTVPLGDWRVRQLREVSLSGLQPGAYDLEIVLRGRRNKKLDEQRKSFTVAWTAQALIMHNYDAAIDQLTYIASRDEVEHLRNLETAEERKQGFEEFWEAHDPTPGTPENELRGEFYRRISIANERFTAFNRDGWRTDRGRIYIQFGEPDQIDDQPVALSGRPYQRWYYYRFGAYRVFTFVDEYEDGDYRLQYPYDGLY